MIQTAINDFISVLKQALGKQLRAVYLYGSFLQEHYDQAESDVNLVAVVSDRTSLHVCRTAMIPFWQEHKETLRLAPLVVRQSSFNRHLQLNPLLSHHLNQYGQHSYGKTVVPLNSTPPTEIEEIAYLAAQLMEASAALAPDLLLEVQAEEARQNLRRLARRVQTQPLRGNETMSELFAMVQVAIQNLVRDLPQEMRFNDERLVNSAKDSNLRAIYEETDSMVMLIPEMNGTLLEAIRWDDLAVRLKDRCHALVVTTADQLRLSIRYELPIDYVLGRYSHKWGQTPLQDFEVAPDMLYRAAARLPSYYLTTNFCRSYLVAEDEDGIHKAIHDLQNRLLNIQLQHELLRRFGVMEAAKPPMALPKRGAVFAERIDAIFYHLDWWADYYTQKWRTVRESSLVTA